MEEVIVHLISKNRKKKEKREREDVGRKDCYGEKKGVVGGIIKEKVV